MMADLQASPSLDEMPSSPMEEHQPVNCDPSQPPTMLWNINPQEKTEIYDDLGVHELVNNKVPPLIPPSSRHHTTPTDSVTETKPPGHSDPIPTHTTPSTIKSEAHIHNGTSCSKRRLLDEINSADCFACFADEVLLQIFKWLPLTKLGHCGRVCKRWHTLVCDEFLWRHVDLSSKKFSPCILGNILQRGPVAVKLSRAKIEEPVFMLNARQKTKKPGKISRKNIVQTITTKVQYLDLSACDASPSTIHEIINSCASLCKLSLESCTVNVSVLTSVGQRAHEMEELNLSMTEGIIDYGMMQLLGDMPNLTSLNLAWTSLSRQTLETLSAKVPPKLEKLNLSGCKTTIDDMIVDQILCRCPNLRELDVSDTTSISEAIFLYLVDHGRIQYLAINRCYSLHYTTFGHLARLRSLRALDVFALIPDNAYETVKELFPGVIFNEHPFSAIARPTIRTKNYIWGIKCHE